MRSMRARAYSMEAKMMLSGSLEPTFPSSSGNKLLEPREFLNYRCTPPSQQSNDSSENFEGNGLSRSFDDEPLQEFIVGSPPTSNFNAKKFFRSRSASKSDTKLSTTSEESQISPLTPHRSIEASKKSSSSPMNNSHYRNLKMRYFRHLSRTGKPDSSIHLQKQILVPIRNRSKPIPISRESEDSPNSTRVMSRSMK